MHTPGQPLGFGTALAGGAGRLASPARPPSLSGPPHLPAHRGIPKPGLVFQLSWPLPAGAPRRRRLSGMRSLCPKSHHPLLLHVSSFTPGCAPAWAVGTTGWGVGLLDRAEGSPPGPWPPICLGQRPLGLQGRSPSSMASPRLPSLPQAPGRVSQQEAGERKMNTGHRDVCPPAS